MKTAKELRVKIIKDTGYLIYENGELFNSKTNKFKKWTKDTNRYVRSAIWIEGKCKMIYQHRVLAEYFIENVHFKPQVNHINGVKHDNRLENLEWVTQSENAIHSFRMGLQKPTRPHMKKVINTITGHIYDSLTESSKDVGINLNLLSKMLTGKVVNTTNLKYYE